MPYRAVVQTAGGAFRIKVKTALEAFAKGGPLQSLLLRYTYAVLIQVSQTAVCNRLHSVEQRLCRWLLLSHDLVRSDELQMTQEYLSHILGGRRESVTAAAGCLQNADLIRYSRGNIKILNRRGLEAVVCECYRVIKTESDRLALNTFKQ